MTYDPYDEAPRRRARGVPWAMLIGVILLAILAGVLAMLLLGGGTPDPSAEPTTSPTTGDMQGSASAAPSADPSASAAAAPSAGPTDVALDTIVVTTVDGLSVRAGPGTDAERLGSLAMGSLNFVAGGPVDADGYRWYVVGGLGLPPNTGCAGEFETEPYNCPVWFGWVASGDTDGTRWLEPQPPECPEEPIAFEEIVIAVSDAVRLFCLGSDPITFRAWWPQLPDEPAPGGVCALADVPTAWLLCYHLNDKVIVIDDADAAGGIGLPVFIDPATDVTMPERGTWIEITLHMDDPAAQSCDDDAAGTGLDEQPPESLVLFCRYQLVVDAVTAVDGP